MQGRRLPHRTIFLAPNFSLEIRDCLASGEAPRGTPLSSCLVFSKGRASPPADPPGAVAFTNPAPPPEVTACMSLSCPPGCHRAHYCFITEHWCVFYFPLAVRKGFQIAPSQDNVFSSFCALPILGYFYINRLI